MRHYAGYDTVSEASEAFNRLRLAEANGKVQKVHMMELSEKVRLPHEKPYVVSWHEWVD